MVGPTTTDQCGHIPESGVALVFPTAVFESKNPVVHVSMQAMQNQCVKSTKRLHTCFWVWLSTPVQCACGDHVVQVSRDTEVESRTILESVETAVTEGIVARQ